MAQPQSSKTRGEFCPECGGQIKFDAVLKHFVCQSCGLTYTDQQLADAKDKAHDHETEQERRRRRQNDYLAWWVSKK